MINIAIYVLLVLEVLVCFLLLAVILVQRSKSQGAGMAFGAGMGETMFGSQVGNVLTRSTVILGVAFLLITTSLAYLTPRAVKGGATSLVPDVEPQQQSQTQGPAPSTATSPSAQDVAPVDFDSSDVPPPALGSAPVTAAPVVPVVIPETTPPVVETPADVPAETPPAE